MQRTSQNPNEANRIDLEKMPTNAQMLIFLVACANSDTLMLVKTSAFTNMFLFVQITACSCNSEFHRHLAFVCG